MVMRPGVNVNSSGVSSSSAFVPTVSTWFVLALTERGPTTPTVVYSLLQYRSLFGERAAWNALTYDSIDAHFRSKGKQIVVQRATGGSATKSSLTLLDGSGVGTLAIDAENPGEYGQRITASVTVTAGTFVIKVYYDGALKHTSPSLNNPAEAVAWGASVAWVNVRDLASATAAPGNNPVNLSTTALSGGTDDRAAINAARRATLVANFTEKWGPGQLSAPGVTDRDSHLALVVHAMQFNRFPVLDLAEGKTKDDYVADVQYLQGQTDNSPYGMAFQTWTNSAGLIPNTTRVIPPSGFVTGRMADVDGTLGVNVPAAGKRGVLPLVRSLRAEWGREDLNDLTAGNVNTLREVQGEYRVYGYRTLSSDPAWIQASNQRLRMELTFRAEQIGQDVLFNAVSGLTGETVSDFKNQLLGMLKEYHDTGQLFGETPDESYVVNVGIEVNPITDLAQGILRARISVKMSPFAEQIDIDIVKYSITEEIAA